MSQQFTPTETMSERDIQLLSRLLADPYHLPQPFKTWLIGFLELSDMNLPLSAVSGLRSRLDALAALVPSKTVLSGNLSGTTDVNGQFVVTYAAAVTSTDSAVASRYGAGPPTPPLPSQAHLAVLSTFNLNPSGFTVQAWHIPTDTPLASYALQFSWIAHVTP